MFRVYSSLLLAFFLFGCASTEPPPPQEVPMGSFHGKQNTPLAKPVKTRELTKNEKKIIGEGIARGLKDPQSAQFRWLPFPESNEELISYCGMVNAKNSYGGYTGFKPFLAGILMKNGKIVGAVLIGADAGRYGEEATLSVCNDKGFRPHEAI
jgi:hypothetical protein